MLDPHLWTQLEGHGVTLAHLELLLRALELQRNGSLAWHFSHGKLSQCDLRVTFASRQADIARVCETVLTTTSDPRAQGCGP
jgi:hypothetical protein